MISLKSTLKLHIKLSKGQEKAWEHFNLKFEKIECHQNLEFLQGCVKKHLPQLHVDAI